MSAAIDAATPSREELLQSRGGALYLKSWLLNRFVVGVLGVVMPVVLIVGDKLFFDAISFPRASLSAYYFSPLGDVFVGTLWATGIFLITYMCFHRNVDNAASSLAGLAAILVAQVPTWPDPGDDPTPLQLKLGRELDQNIHTWSAVIFIAMLAWLSWRFGAREGDRGNRKMSFAHRALAVVMAVTALLALLLNYAFHVSRIGDWSGLLIVELVCTYAFGVSWLLKGAELWKSLVGRGWYGPEAAQRPAVETGPSAPAGGAAVTAGPPQHTAM